MKLNILNLLRNKSGFSLPEVMVGGAILAGVALAGATLFQNQTKAQQVIEQDLMLQQYHRTLAQTLENDHNCNATFQSYYGNPSLNEGTVHPIVAVCDTSTTTCNTDFDASNVVKKAPHFAREGEYIDRVGVTPSKQIWLFQGMTFGNTLTKTGPMTLRVKYQLNPRIGNRTLIKDIVVNMRFNDDVTPDPMTGVVPQTGFIRCFNDQESSINNLQSDMCKSFYANAFISNVTSEGALVYWDEESQTCKLNGTPDKPLKDCTAPGLMVDGISSNGTVHCRSISEGFDAGPSVNTSACAATTNVKLVWDGTRLRVTCVP